VTSPLVTVLINNYNYAAYLPQCIESALAQRYARLEVVVVDDASTDGSREVLARYQGRIVAVLQATNSGQAAAINAGVHASRGDVVMLLDADDYLYPQAAERVVAAWRPELSKLHYRLHLEDATGRVVDTYPKRGVRLESGDVVPGLLRTGRYQTTVTSGNAFSRRTLEAVLPIPELAFRISADGYLVTVAPFHGPIATIEEPLGVYRLHGNNAWAATGRADGTAALAGRLRKYLLHDADKRGALGAAAQAAGRTLLPGFELRDSEHLETRLASLVVDPAAHPYASDHRAALALRGADAVCGLRTSQGRRPLLALWFLAVGLLPHPLALRAVYWRIAPNMRPPWVGRLLKTLRRGLFGPASR
jgi:hypothetical protein